MPEKTQLPPIAIAIVPSGFMSHLQRHIYAGAAGKVLRLIGPLVFAEIWRGKKN